MQLESTDKIQRVLGIYKKLVSGEIVSKVEEANNYGVNERSIQRDIDDIRSFMESEVGRTGIINNVIYDRAKKGFRLEQQNPTELTNGQMLAICKILLDSRDEDGRMPYIGPQYLVFGAEAGFAAATVKDSNDVEVRLAQSHPGDDIQEPHFVIEIEPIFLPWTVEKTKADR